MLLNFFALSLSFQILTGPAHAVASTEKVAAFVANTATILPAISSDNRSLTPLQFHLGIIAKTQLAAALNIIGAAGALLFFHLNVRRKRRL